MHGLLLLRLAAPISSWDTLREIANDSVAQKKGISESEMANLMNRFEERRVQWVAACNTLEARIRKSCAIPKATGWAELEADDFDLPAPPHRRAPLWPMTGGKCMADDWS